MGHEKSLFVGTAFLGIQGSLELCAALKDTCRDCSLAALAVPFFPSRRVHYSRWWDEDSKLGELLFQQFVDGSRIGLPFA